jgi:hypothetical protein
MAKRKQVTWKDGNKPSPALRPLPYWQDVPVTEKYSEILAEKLVVGNIFFTTEPLNRTVHTRGYADPPYPYLTVYPGLAMYPQGSIAVYAGTVRVEEQKGNSLLRAVRHSFIIAGSRYITNNLNHFMPI